MPVCVNANINQLEKFLSTFKKVFGILAFIIKHCIRENQRPFMSKILHKAVMTRSRLCYKCLKNKTQYNKSACKKQRNYCVILFGIEKSFFKYSDTKNIIDNNFVLENFEVFSSK